MGETERDIGFAGVENWTLRIRGREVVGSWDADGVSGREDGEVWDWGGEEEMSAGAMMGISL